MGTIIVGGLKSNKLITQGYSSAEVVIIPPPTGSGSHAKKKLPVKPQPRLSPRLLSALLTYLTFKVTK